jgi:hypothetical protein
MQAVKRQNDHHDEVRDEQRGIEPVPAIEVLEGVISVVRTEIVAKIVSLLEEKEGDGVNAERAFESERFQQSRASSGELKKYCTVVGRKADCATGRIFPE